MNYVITFLLSFVLVLPATAQFAGVPSHTEDPIDARSGSIRGVVRTPDGQAAAFVSVLLKGSTKGAVTNEAGEYLLRNVKPGTHRLQIRFVGYRTEELTVTVEPDQVSTVDVSLVENADELAEVVVAGRQSPNEQPVAIGKIAVRPLDLPQSLTTVDRVTLERQQVLRLSEALMNVTGVYLMGATGGYQEEIAGRGFAFGSSNTFKNGARYFNGTLPEMTSLERVEILKGSSAILFGNVAAGGILNLVTKKPQFQRGGEVSLRVGSFGFVKPTFDVYGSVLGSQRVAFRLNGTYETAKSFREVVESKRVYVNPSVLIKLGGKTDLLLEGDYLFDERTPDFGTGAINYQIADLPRERFIGVPWSNFRIEQRTANATLTHQLSKSWQLRATGAYRDYVSELFGSVRPNAGGQFIRPDGTWIRGIQRTSVQEAYYLGQLDLSGQFKTGFLGHQVLVGADADRYDTRTTAYRALARYDTTNVFDPTRYRARTDLPELPLNTLTTAPIRRVGVYAQDLISIAQKLKVLVGLRYSYQQTESTVLTYADNKTTNSLAFDGAFTPRLGLVYQPVKASSVFASYANSFTLNTGVDVAGNALPPSFINQYEVGTKNDFFGGKLSANVTAYRIVNSNLAQTSLENGNTNANIKELAGEVTSKGVEIDLSGKPARGLTAALGYSYNETRYTQSNTYVVGSLLRYNPAHTANASAFYAFQNKTLRGFNLGFIAQYFGERQAGRSVRVTVPNDPYRLIPIAAFTQFDATAGYAGARVALRVKAGNVLNAMSYFAHDDNSVNPIAPRNYSATLSYKF
jgi:iron complex outermembrane receptor protein